MNEPGRFLTAEWNNLLMLNYAVEPMMLQRFVPSGTELDAFDGHTYASLVGFEFNRTRVLGFTIPFHRSFEEVNLRLYVRRGARRGVVFIRELVPRYAIAAVARFAFGENYSCVPMTHRVRARVEVDSVEGTSIEAAYFWSSGKDRCAMSIETEGERFLPLDGALSQFITEHYWGYAKQRDGGCLEYEVQHPRWLVRNAREAGFSGDAAPYYGDEFGKIFKRPPDSAFLAEGSPVTVFRGTRIA